MIFINILSFPVHQRVSLNFPLFDWYLFFYQTHMMGFLLLLLYVFFFPEIIVIAVIYHQVFRPCKLFKIFF